MTGRGTSNSDQRGNTAQRRARREYLLATYGDGTTCPCYRCGELLDDSTVQADRIIAGMDGGTYVRGNIRPACGPCNIFTGNMLRDFRRRFGRGRPVRFATGFTLYEVVGGESEMLLQLRTLEYPRRHRYDVPRHRVLPATMPAGLIPEEVGA